MNALEAEKGSPTEKRKLKTYRINHLDGSKKDMDRLKCEIKLRKARFNQDK